MSSFLIIQKQDQIVFGSDSAVSTTIDNKAYRIKDYNVKKIHKINNSLLFCSGNMLLSSEIVDKIKKYNTDDVNEIKAIAKSSYNNFDNTDEFTIDIALAKVYKGKSIVYQISPYNNFEIVEYIVDKPSDIGIVSGGIKTDEVFNTAYEKIKKGVPIKKIYTETYNQVAYEQIGGFLTLHFLSNIEDKVIGKYKIHDDFVDYYSGQVDDSFRLVVGETIKGRIIAGEQGIFEGLDIYESDEVGSRLLATLGKYEDSDGNENRGLLIKHGAINVQSTNGASFITGDYISVGNAGMTNLGTSSDSIRFWAGASFEDRNVAPFRVTHGGFIVATHGRFQGNIEAQSMTLSGGTYQGIRVENDPTAPEEESRFVGDIIVGDGNNLAGISGEGSSSTSIRFWAGHEDRNSAPFRVQQDGKVVASNIDIVGGSIDVDSDVTVGNWLEFNGTGSRGVRFNTGATIFGTTDSGGMATIYISASDLMIEDGNITMGNSSSTIKFNGTVDFSGATVTGLS